MRHECRTLDARAFGLAAGTVAAALTTLCAIAIVLVPGATTAAASTLLHLDMTEMTRTMSWGVYFGGLFGWGIGAGLVFAAAAGLYNRFARAQAPATEAEGRLPAHQAR